MSLKHFHCIGLGGDLPWDQTMVKLGHLYLVTVRTEENRLIILNALLFN